jgi:two-component system, chemotaxis family, sensor kinase CheA
MDMSAVRLWDMKLRGRVSDIGNVDNLTREFLIESGEGVDCMERCLNEMQAGTCDAECLAQIFRAVHTIKGTVGFMGFPRLEKLAHVGEHLLSLLRDGKRSIDDRVIDALTQLMDRLRVVLQLIETTEAEGRRDDDDDSDLVATLEQAATGAEVAGKRDGKADGVKGLPESREGALSHGPPAAESTVRVDVETLNRLMNLVGELVQTRNQFLKAEVGEESFALLGQRLDTVTASLRESVMEARLQPVGQLFQRFPRLARDVAQICGKSVRLDFSGGDTGLDKSLLETLKDPLTHAVRNAIDHGIETPAQRLMRGKPAEGKVHLRAFHEGGQIVVEVVDDGKGINPQEVVRRALERGLISAERSKTIGEAEAMQLLFEPGFSTAETVTMISGRGVGMDVVRANVERTGGSVELHSVPGQGTTLRIRVPLTLAIVPALVARCGGQMFAVPHSSLLEMVGIRKTEEAGFIQRVGNAKMFTLRDRLVPLIDLCEVLGIARQSAGGCYVAILEAKGRQFGLMVDDMAEPQEIVVKPLSSILSGLNVYSGATLLGDGRVALILDTAGVARAARLCDTSEAVPVAGPVEASGKADPGVTRASMLVFADHRGDSTVVPLECVERIEKVAPEAIDRLADEAVLQYRGELVALQDPGRLLDEAGSGHLVLICRRPGNPKLRVGLVVRGVVDVAEGEVMAGSASRNGAVARVNGRLAMFCPGFEMVPARREMSSNLELLEAA